jgi:ATP-dependent RNA helicase DDX43
LPKLRKDFYEDDSDVPNMLPEEVEMFRKVKNNVVVNYTFGGGEKDIPNPVQTFEQAFRPYPEILEKIYKQNFQFPSPIQCQAWPILLKGYDPIGNAQTGTGKTLTFLLPAPIHIDRQPIPTSERSGANVLVLAAKRQLVLQIEEDVKRYDYRGLKCVCVYMPGATGKDK